MKYPVKPPRLERFGPLVIAALCRRHRLPLDREQISRRITAQWQEFFAVRDALRPAVPDIDYGIAQPMTDGGTTFDYCCGTAIGGTPDLPAGLSRIELPVLRCAVFQQTEHVSKTLDTVRLVFGTVLPLAGLEPADVKHGMPEFIERYGKSFNPDTGLGGFELLVPLKE